MPLRRGDPVFECFDGGVVRFDPAAPSKTYRDDDHNDCDERDEAAGVRRQAPGVPDGGEGGECGVFINEGAYYYEESGVGLGIVRKGATAVPSFS